jgi:hypothetical protein
MSSSITVPPGIEDEQHNVIEIAAKGGDDNWLPFDREKTGPIVNGFIHDRKDEKVNSIDRAPLLLCKHSISIQTVRFAVEQGRVRSGPLCPYHRVRQGGRG